MPKTPSPQIYLLKNPYPFPKIALPVSSFCKQTLHHLNLITNKPLILFKITQLVSKIQTKSCLLKYNYEQVPGPLFRP